MQHIGFNLNKNEYSIPIIKVREIMKTPRITRMPQAPSYIEGVTNIRGNIVPIVNLKRLISLEENGMDCASIIVVSSGRVTFGVLVDGITGVLNIEESSVEPSQSFLGERVDQVEGIAKLPGRMVILLNPRKLLPVEDIGLLDDIADDICEKDEDTVEIVRTVQTMAGEVKLKEICSSKDYFETRGISSGDPRYMIFDDIISFMEALSDKDYESADKAVRNIVKKGQSGLFAEVGKIARKLHESLRDFRDSIDPRFKEMAAKDVPDAVESLQSVIDKTEDAANKTLGIVEKYILSMDELAGHMRNLKEPADSVHYIKTFKNNLEDDLTEILTTQSFQDLTGQTLKKVIKLIGDLEKELVKLIADFGLKIDLGAATEAEVPEKILQADVEGLLKEFGF
jgi:chemotaxis signal transduction protein/chemotaxis regulatin CheY-phosphate phosphatase CheZ